MADTSLVEAAIVTLLGNTLYPNGTSSPSAITAPTNIERGWPTEADIRAAVKAGQVLVRVYAVKGLSKDDTRYPRQWLDVPEAVVTLTATLSYYTLTLAGIPALGQFVGVVSAGVGYSYAVLATDTLDSVATAVAALVPGASATGPVVTLPDANTLPEATITQGGYSTLEAARECQLFSVVAWAPTPGLRDIAMQLIHAACAYTYRLPLADNSTATLMDIQATGPDDWPSRAGEWRRDLRLNYDYPVDYTLFFPPVTVAIQQNTPAPAGAEFTFYNV